MAAGDLPHEGEAEPGAGLLAPEATERLEDVAAIGVGDTRAVIAHHELDGTVRLPDAHLDRRRAGGRWREHA